MLPCRRAGIFNLSRNKRQRNKACAEKAKKSSHNTDGRGAGAWDARERTRQPSSAMQHRGLQPGAKADRRAAVRQPGCASAPQPGRRVFRRALVALCKQPKAVRLPPARAAGLSTLHTSRKARAGAQAASL